MSNTETTGNSRDVSSEIAYLTRALKSPALREAADRLAGRARAENWSRQECLAACLQREASARESRGGGNRIRAAKFPARKSLEEFDSTMHADLNATSSLIRGHWISSPPAATPSSWAHRAPAKHTWRSGWLHEPARQVTGRCLPPPPNGSLSWPKRIRTGASAKNSPAWAAARCWSLTRWAVSRSDPRPPACSSN